ncbi:MAG: hypothetical protein NTV03_00265, partial [Candidatus Nomurabacteria bacterium]|nr:hypothetical protein [Candidatus Nomurabacteria bacterium]
HDYYYCTNGKKICTSYKNYIRENDLYKLLLPILEKLSFDKEEIELLYLAAKEDTLKDSGYFSDVLENLKKEETLILERENKLVDAFLDGAITKETLAQRNLDIENQKINIKKQISEIEARAKGAVSTLEPVKKLLLDCNIWAKEFLDLKPDKMQNIAHELLWNLSMKDKNIVSYQLKSPYSDIAKLPENASFNERLGD